MVVALDSGKIIAALIAYGEVNSRVSFGIIEDMAVDKEYRSKGVGKELVAMVEKEAKKRKCGWMFLESGKHNISAHKFFKSTGYNEISHIFSKKIS